MEKIVIIRPKIGFGLGGAETHAATLAIELLKYGYKIGLIANKINFPENISNAISFYPVKLKARGSVLKYWLFLKKAKQILKSINFDYLISPFRFPESDILILCDPLQKFWLTQKYKSSILLKLCYLRPRYRFLLSIEKNSIESAKKIVTIFKMGKDLISQYYPQVLSKTFICHRGIDFQRFNPKLKQTKTSLKNKLGFNSKNFLILFVGKDPKRKGLPLLLKVVKDLPPFCKLLIAGIDGKSSERIIYLGHVKNIEIFYAISDLVVLPTYYDPGAMVTLEAIASGTPVITSIYDGTKEFIKEGINGYITTLEKEDLKNKILKALETKFDPYKCYETIKFLTWENYVKCLINLIS